MDRKEIDPISSSASFRFNNPQSKQQGCWYFHLHLHERFFQINIKQSKWFNIYIYEKKGFRKLTFDILWSQTEQIPFKSSLMVRDVHGRKELYAEGMSCLTAGLGVLRRKVQDWWLGSHDEKIQIFRQGSLNGTHLEGSNFMQTDGHFSEIYPLQCMVWVGISSWPLSHVMVLLDAFGTLMFDIRYPSLFLWKTWIT